MVGNFQAGRCFGRKAEADDHFCSFGDFSGTIQEIAAGNEIIKGISILERFTVILVTAIVIDDEKGIQIVVEVAYVTFAEKIIGQYWNMNDVMLTLRSVS